jgi:PhzF family phenazine biosynthesis protein
MSRVPIFVVDAFADEPFTGNPAGVVVLSEAADPGWMQSVAAEMKHAETAFVRPTSDGFELRWFTPTTEVDLCGHATLATAHILAGLGHEGSLSFATKSGRLRSRPEGSQIALDFPSEKPSAVSVGPGLQTAIGTDIRWAGRNRMDFFVEVADEATVRGLKPNLSAIAALPARGLIVTARAGEFDFVSRFFGPQVGIDEDPVTGSAHCALGPFWAERLGKNELSGFQASKRGGRVGVRVRGDRVDLIGNAITVLSGELLV